MFALLTVIPMLVACDDDDPGPGPGFIPKYTSYYDSQSDIKNLNLNYNGEEITDVVVYLSTIDLNNAAISFFDDYDLDAKYVINRIELQSLVAVEGYSFEGQFNGVIEYKGQVISPYGDTRCFLELSLTDI